MTTLTWAASILAVIFATLFADAYWSLREREKRMKGRNERIQRLEEQVRYWQGDAAYWREAATGPRLVWPEQVRNTWTRIARN